MSLPVFQKMDPRKIRVIYRRRKRLQRILVYFILICMTLLFLGLVGETAMYDGGDDGIGWTYAERHSRERTFFMLSLAAGLTVAALGGCVVLSAVWRCPQCGKSLGRDFAPNFCPNCGANFEKSAVTGNENAV